MSRELLNTLFVMTPGAYARLDGDTVRVELEGEKLIQVPLIHIGQLVFFGATSLTPQLLMRCAEEGKDVVFLDYAGNFKARVIGPESGNVLLRAAQYKAHCDSQMTLNIARPIVAGKIKNCRNNLLRGLRDSGISAQGKMALDEAVGVLGELLGRTAEVTEINALRGIEGQAAAIYFEVFDHLIKQENRAFRFQNRSRRPPRDRINALISFVYTLLLAECESALASVGLDTQFGFLHVLRPGRPALALDLVEEFRPSVGDRFVLALINRGQIEERHFEERAGGSVLLNEDGRKVVLGAYQKRKQEEVHHSLLKTKVPLGLVPQLQARLLSRYIRGDTDYYIPYTVK